MAALAIRLLPMREATRWLRAVIRMLTPPHAIPTLPRTASSRPQPILLFSPERNPRRGPGSRRARPANPNFVGCVHWRFASGDGCGERHPHHRLYSKDLAFEPTTLTLPSYVGHP